MTLISRDNYSDHDFLMLKNSRLTTKVLSRLASVKKLFPDNLIIFPFLDRDLHVVPDPPIFMNVVIMPLGHRNALPDCQF